MEKERAIITRLNDNTFSDANDHIVSINIKYETDNSIQSTKGYRGNSYTDFIRNMMSLLEIDEKNQMLERSILACTEYDKLLAIGNELGNKWIDLKKVNEIIDGDIIKYFKEREDLER